MDADQLRELATNALQNHWPPHLGVHTDAEKIEYLARELENAAGDIIDAGDLQERFDEVSEERDELVEEVAELTIQLKLKEGK